MPWAKRRHKENGERRLAGKNGRKNRYLRLLLNSSKEVRRLRARIAQLERQQTMNLRTSLSAKRNAAAKCVESEQIEQLKLELKETNRKLKELGNNLKDALEKGMNQLKGKLAGIRADQNKQQLNIVALEKKVAVLNDTINGNGLNQLKQNCNDGKKSVDKRHKCTHCPYSTHRAHDLKMHMLIHTGQKPHECQECGQHFRQSQHLSVHQRVHTGERAFKCQHCGKRFGRIHHLSDHQSVHTRERAFKCDHCDKSFSFRANLTRHLRSIKHL